MTHILGSKTLITYEVSYEKGDKIVTYKLGDGSNMELAKIQLDPTFVEDPLVLLQLLMTPNIHNSLLASIVPFVEQVLPQTEGPTHDSLASWLLQTRSLLTGPEEEPVEPSKLIV